MAKILAVANQKGGVGKTTTCVNLAASLAAMRCTVLLMDLDPQGNATMGSGVDKNDLFASANEVMLGESEIQFALVSTAAGYDLLPANSELTNAEVQLLQGNLRERRLLQAVSKVQGRYDYILIDCPPSLNMLTVNALVAADGVLIPMQCEYYALEGLTGLLGTIEKINQTVNSKLIVEGLIRTMFDPRNSLTMQVSEQLFKHFGNRVYETVIPRNVRLAEAPSFGMPALLYDKQAAGTTAYLALAREIVQQRTREFKPPSSEVTPKFGNWVRSPSPAEPGSKKEDSL
jgi:chromosome partitioning protein